MRKVLFQKWIDNSNLSEMINEGYFHAFTTDDGGDLYAIIESTDGLLIDVKPGRFKFIEPLEAIDWEQRRYELAKELLLKGYPDEVAISIADEFIHVYKKQKQ